MFTEFAWRKAGVDKMATVKRPNVKVQIYFVQEGDYVVAYCPSLDLSSYGTTTTKAKKSFSEVLDIFMTETLRKGTLEKVLLELGWKLQQKPSFKYEPPSLTSDKRARSLRQKASRIEQKTVSLAAVVA